jgi:hypothetical protein
VDDRSDVEQQLRDERARRRVAEQRIADLTERAELWRIRAEERSERIDRLLAAQQRKTNTFRKWLKGLTGGYEQPPPSTAPRVDDSPPMETTRSTWPTFKATRVVSAVDDMGIARVIDSFDNSSLSETDPAELDRADLVILEPAAIPGLPADTRNRLEKWGRGSARQPVVVWATSGDGAMPDAVPLSDFTVTDMLGSFDPARHHPGVSTTSSEPTEHAQHLSVDLIERAACGIGFDESPGAGTAARRWAYRHHAPWVKARAILDLAGVSVRSPIPAVAAILVSHRPEAIPAAVTSILSQTHRPLELVVGIHGSSTTGDITEVVDGADIPVSVLTFDRERSLGECLNLAAERSSAPLIAKIDDDDRYGPAYIEDSFHALCYSGADIVGKGAHFTYLAQTDSTVLRRPGLEEKFIDGSPNGATLMFRREAWDRVGFPHRPRHVDTGFLRAARSTGAIVYATSRWEFCYVRRPSGHTWDAEAEVFLAGSEPAWSGFHPELAEVADVDFR